MDYNKKSFLIFVTVLSILPTCKTQPPALSNFDYKSASVLPFYHSRRTKYVILSRERWGRDKGTYDDFGGKRDPGEEHPVVSAGREFWEEAALEGAIGFTLDDTLCYIDIAKTRNTHFIVANTTKKNAKNVTYITNFGKYKTQFLDNFYKASRSSANRASKEKDRLALVKWHDLKEAIIHQQHPHDQVYVNAYVLNPKTNQKELQKILLRPYLVIKLQSFFKDEPYTKGKHRKIRFYSQTTPVYQDSE